MVTYKCSIVAYFSSNSPKLAYKNFLKLDLAFEK
jgi:hypothetical protein